MQDVGRDDRKQDGGRAEERREEVHQHRAHNDRRLAHIAEAVEHGLKVDRPLFQLYRRDRAHHQHRANDRQVAHGVERVDRPDAAQARDHQAAHAGADDPRDLSHDRVQAEGVCDVLARNHIRDERLARRAVERARHGGQRHEQVDDRRGDVAHKGCHGQHRRREHHARLGKEQHLAPVLRIGDDAPDQREDQHRQHAEHADQSERDRIVGQQVDVPGNGYALHLRARHRDQLPEPEQAKIPVAQRGKRINLHNTPFSLLQAPAARRRTRAACCHRSPAAPARVSQSAAPPAGSRCPR